MITSVRSARPGLPAEPMRSARRLSWALAAFGAQQVGRLFAAREARAAASIRAVSGALRDATGWDELSGRGDAAVGEAVDRAFDWVASASGDPLAGSLGWLERAAWAAGGGRRRELRNKVLAFRTFREAATGGVDGSLAAALDRAAELGPYRELWAVEGLGFARAGGTLRPPVAPARVRLPLHTGAGLRLARDRLRGGAWDRPWELRACLAAHAGACRASAAPGCWRMVFEPFGLVVRQVRPDLLGAVDRELRALDPELAELFWHGVGRGLYFVPSRLPAPVAWSLAAARSEPPDAAARRNALAGLAWAVTLVNVRHPEELEALLGSAGTEPRELAAIAHGAVSALLVWYASHGEDAVLERFLEHRPAPAAEASWRRWVAEPGRDALAGVPDLEGDGSLAGRFRLPGRDDGPAGVDASDESPVLGRLAREIDGWVGRMVDSLDRVRARP